MFHTKQLCMYCSTGFLTMAEVIWIVIKVTTLLAIPVRSAVDAGVDVFGSTVGPGLTRLEGKGGWCN